jgi:gliding motility-associated-like protein
MKKILLGFTGIFFAVQAFSQAPTIDCPGNIVVDNDPGTCNAVVTYPAPTCSSNCTGATITQTDGTGLTSGSTFHIGTNIQEYTISNIDGSNTCTFTVTVVDVESPTWDNCPGNFTVNTEPGLCGATVNYVVAASDNCGTPLLTQTDASGLSSGDFYPFGDHLQDFHASDAAGNNIACNFIVTVEDNEPPVFTFCPSNIVINSTPGDCGAIVNYTTPSGTDNCPNPTIFLNSGLPNGSLFPVGLNVQQYIIQDISGNQAFCTFNILVVDIEDPVFTNCTPITVNNTPGQCGANVTFSVPAATDNCAGVGVSQTSNPGFVSGSFFPVGTTTIEYTATDLASNTATCNLDIIVVDIDAPSIACPPTITVAAPAGQCSAVVNFTTPTASDNCPGTVVTQIDATGLSSGSSFPAGTTTLTFQATDGAGNTDACSFDVVVNETTPPTITCPPNQQVFTDASCQGTLADYTTLATATDNCGGPVTISQSPVPGSTITGVGLPQTVTLTATDESGNSASCNMQVTLIDNVPPNVTCPGNQFVAGNANCEALLPNLTPLLTANDNCTGSITKTQSPAAGTTITGTTTVTLTATDASGNSSSCTVDVFIVDGVAPTIACPGPQTLFVGAGCSASLPDYTSLASASDNCDPNPIVTQNPLPGTTLTGVGFVQIVTLTVTDAGGLQTSCTFNVTLADNTPPTIICPGPQTGFIDANCQFTVPDYRGLANASDNCPGVVNLTQLPAPGSIITGSTVHTITINGTDFTGNAGSCSFQLTLQDTIRPFISCPGPQTLLVNANCEALLPSYIAAIVASDNCGAPVTIAQTPAPGSTITNAMSPINVVFVATDDSGNQDSCFVTVTLIDNIAPTISCPPNPNLPVTATCDALLPDYSTIAVFADNCTNTNDIIFTQSPLPGLSLSGVGTTQVVQLTVEDESGNVNTCSFQITLADTTAPAINCPGNQQVNITANCEFVMPDYTSFAGVIDNCDAAPVVTQFPAIGTNHAGVVTVTLVATDASGNTSSCTFDVIPNDNLPPVITCPGNVNTCNPVVNFPSPTAIDNCGVASLVRTDANQSLVSGSTFPVGTTVISYEATDVVGNTSSCSFSITVFELAFADAGQDVTIEEFNTAQLNGTISANSTFIWSPTVFLSNPNTLTPTSSTTSTITYTLTVTTTNGCVATDQVTVFVNQINELIINNIITPNGDGKNDTWDVNKPALISGCRVNIYNRWGKEVWTSSAYNNEWTGVNMSGEELPEGTYYYVIDCADGESYKGSIALMRLSQQ